jgi:poly-gamma-glutamate capsule biosynthesis protein CapA/YwtB (metallophosphatase superfamily)
MKLAFVGDVMLGRLVNEVLKREGPTHPWGDTLPLFQAADVRICNLECVISDIGQPWSVTPKVFHFRTDEKNVAVLKAAGIDLVSVANNHVLDYEYEALLRMIRVLREHGMALAGAGGNAVEASAPAIYRTQGTTIGFMAGTDNEPGWEAGNDRPGVHYIPVDLKDARAKQLLACIAQARQDVGLLILSMHWGPNWGYRPAAGHRAFARALIDAGADIVYGHSCHVVQGIEIYRGKPILYSTGDFADDYAVDEIERNDRSFFCLMDVEDGNVASLKIYPTVVRNMQARRARGADLEQIARKMQQLCTEFETPTVWLEREECLAIAVA